MNHPYDFGGWATKFDLKCSDGRTIKQSAFTHCDGKKVPLVWNHQYANVENVLGHAYLKNCPEGVYAYGSFNDTEAGTNAKKLLLHGDISALSIFANRLKQVGGDVVHGVIREVSLVLAGANPGAEIVDVLEHSDSDDYEAEITYGDDGSVELYHVSDEDPKSEPDKKEEDKTVGDIVDSMTEEQKNVLYALVAKAAGEELPEEEAAHSEIKKNTNNKEDQLKMSNVFENKDQNEQRQDTLTHDEMRAVFNDVKRYGTLKESALAHGIENIDYLFPDAKNLTNTPLFISREMSWVAKVMAKVHKTPFSRIKTMFADITEDEARALGYIKGNLKKEEFFSLARRTTTPQTIYKKQKLDRDDIVDITDFDVVAWIKSEMRVMLDEELARAILIGDGRLNSSQDKIKEDNIRPVWTDADLFTIKADIGVDDTVDADARAKAFIRASVKSRKGYKGSGNPDLYTTEDMLTDCLLLEDGVGRVIYDSIDKLATALRVASIVTVEVMENKFRTRADTKVVQLLGLIVNLNDYNVGADKGGAIAMFDDFDIDYNQQKYLIETRCSGALTRPYSAIALEMVDTTPTP